ncbi:MAG: hypothetical protein JWL76_628 [Thermoleophilia bacterium]|nr:hypothetical protein [Thermoleophilia bacterium]
MNYDELQSLPALISIPQAGEVCGFGRARAYQEAQRLGGIIPTISVGSRRRLVPTAELLRNLGIEYVGPHRSQPATTPSIRRSWRHSPDDNERVARHG